MLYSVMNHYKEKNLKSVDRLPFPRVDDFDLQDSRSTLEYEINVPVRLLISKIFSHRYALISDGTL